MEDLQAKANDLALMGRKTQSRNAANTTPIIPATFPISQFGPAAPPVKAAIGAVPVPAGFTAPPLVAAVAVNVAFDILVAVATMAEASELPSAMSKLFIKLSLDTTPSFEDARSTFANEE